ncbi:hypothetical protein DPEC_G00026750 [Dallia pectoralis]|uniref:Uncharacterized protein n=1 Tax=Dallia pectoralis TaxID=75939 RepID=A0ACC2HHR6_DALPE|nr:hypothetical protein DPEC_G00026750 [Dallia pectoralis]
MGFTRHTSTSHSQQDGVVINCQSLRLRTPLGIHFKSAWRFCRFGLELAWQTGRVMVQLRFQASTSGWQHLVPEIETLCLLMCSCDIFINPFALTRPDNQRCLVTSPPSTP